MAERKLLSQINVTPFVDVMLVLLIIFMITTPLMQEGIDVNLPQVKASEIKSSEDPLIVSIDSNRRIYIDGKLLKRPDLSRAIIDAGKKKKDAMVLLRADETVPYGFVVAAMADIKRAGIEKVGMVTEPRQEEKR